MAIPFSRALNILWSLVSVLCIITHLSISQSAAQSETPRFNIYIDVQFVASLEKGGQTDWGLEQVVSETIRQQQIKGYYLAELDSVAWDGSGSSAAIYINNGPQMHIEQVQISGIEHLRKEEIRALMDSRNGQILSSEQLNADVDRVIQHYEGKGFPFVKVTVPDVSVVKNEGGRAGIVVNIQIEEGDRVTINDIIVVGLKRTRQAYLEFLMGFKTGEVLRKNLDLVQGKLASSELFTQVSPIELIKVGEGEYIAAVQVQENVPGSFDLVLGYQPSVNSSNSGGVVGNGHLDLRNMFGMGRRISLRLNRLPGQISALDANFVDTYFWGSSFSIEAGFQGLQQDSTYNQQSYRGALGYRLFEGGDVFATISREAVRPGQSGVELVGGAQRIARSEVTFWGFSIRYRKLDSSVNPRKGIFLETGVEGGRKRRMEFGLGVSGDTTMSTKRLQQQRLNATLRSYIPFFKRQALVLGNDSHILVSEDFDTSDLFRLGGAQSLRGYDEDRFRGRIVSRVLMEWRYLFERTSYAYLFFDAGYVDRPRTTDFDSERNIYPGYGLGMQFQTGIGLVNTSLALSTLEAALSSKGSRGPFLWVVMTVL